MTVVSSKPVTVESDGIELVGILESSPAGGERGVIIVVGGPQYRVGSHRQFVLLARFLANAGYPVMRFDHQGVGDSDGELIQFENIGSNIRAAIDHFFQANPKMSEVVLWALCDAASAAMMYAHSDSRVSGLVLLNPWVRSDVGLAKAYLGSYYFDKIRSRQFWRQLFNGEIAVIRSILSFVSNLRKALGYQSNRNHAESTAAPAGRRRSYIDRMRDGLEKFGGRVLFVLSGNDLTASEFMGLVDRDKRWTAILREERCDVTRLPLANHTFSTRKFRDEVNRRTESWLSSW